MEKNIDNLIYDLIGAVRQTMPYISSRRAAKRLQHIATIVSKELKQKENKEQNNDKA